MNPLNSFKKFALFGLLVFFGNSLIGQTSFNFTVNQPQLPEADFAVVYKDDRTQFAFWDSSRAYSFSITDYLWDFGDGNTSPAQNTPHVYAQLGVYNVCLAIKTTKFCKDTICQEVNSWLGIDDQELGIQGLNISPNPFETEVAIAFEVTRESMINVSIYNILGEKVVTLMDGREEPGMKRLIFNSEERGVSSDVYFVNMTVDDELITHKIIKKN